MKRAISINNITFNYPLLVSENFNSDNFMGNKTLASSGKLIVNAINKGSLSKEVSLYSGDGGWIDIKTKNKLLKDIDIKEKIVNFDDDSSVSYYYNLEKAIEFEALFEGANWYKIKINLLKG